MNKKNVVLFTLDDLNYNTLGCFGAPVKDVSPNIDRFCEENIKLTNANVTIGVCQPSRSVMLTGLYPHCNGARGFEAIDASCTTLNEVLHWNGYYNGIIGKEDHVAPKFKFCWDFYQRTLNDENNWGRDPENYYGHVSRFLDEATAEGKPFFLMVNSHDPHRPFAGADGEIKKFGRHVACDYTYTPEEVDVKGCHPDLPLIRKEMAQYYSSVRRADQCFGRVMDALKERGLYDECVILFLSDNGMALPFCKTNCYLNSTKSPYIFKLPASMAEGKRKQVDVLVNGIDITPTFLEVLGLDCIEGVNGHSFVPALTDNKEYQDDIYTLFFKTSVNPDTKEPGYYPMRAVQDKHYVYIYNGWSDGKKEFRNESMVGLTYKAMVEAAKTDPEIQKRVDLYLFRVKEEFYCLDKDPDCLKNLIDNPDMQEKISFFKKRMESYMIESRDAYLDRFRREALNK